MKKIVITETQLKKITQSLIIESNITDIMGLRTEINPDGTVSFYRKDKQKVNIRFTTRFGDVNITSITEQEGSYYITTRKITTPQEIDSDGVKKLINFINSPEKTPVKILWNIKTGDLMAKKV